jgi:hypothetical protein
MAIGGNDGTYDRTVIGLAPTGFEADLQASLMLLTSHNVPNRVFAVQHGSNAVVYLLDNASTKRISTPSMFGDVRTAAPSGRFITAWPTNPATATVKNLVGHVLCLTLPPHTLNYVATWHDGTNCKLAKWINGTPTVLIATATTCV